MATPYIYPGDFNLDGKVNCLLNFQTTERGVAAAKMNVQMLIGEINTQENMFRTGRADSPHCIYCINSENIKVVDTLDHILFKCPILR